VTINASEYYIWLACERLVGNLKLSTIDQCAEISLLRETLVSRKKRN
jgi:hypothetical protein